MVGAVVIVVFGVVVFIVVAVVVIFVHPVTVYNVNNINFLQHFRNCIHKLMLITLYFY